MIRASHSENAALLELSQLRLLVVESVPGRLLSRCPLLHEYVSCLQFSTVEELSEIGVALLAPHIILLELDGEGGVELDLAARMHRLWPGVGLILVCEPDQMSVRLQGYARCADYCLVKPLIEVELISVIDALVRRLRMQVAPAGDCWVIDSRRQMLGLPDGRFLELSRNEYLVLQCLQRAPDQTASRQALAEALGVNYMTYDERRLEAIVSRLRRKIATFAGREAPIRALRNKGYLFTGSLLACQHGRAEPRRGSA